MPTKDPEKLRAIWRRKAAKRRARSPAWAAAQIESLRKYRPNPETVREWKRKNRVIQRKWNAEFLRQQKVLIAGRPKPTACEVCASEATICWDHDHKTDKFRGWICSGCNTALGHAKDNPETLRKLALYLEAFEARKASIRTISSRRVHPKISVRRVERDWLFVGSDLYGDRHHGSGAVL